MSVLLKGIKKPKDCDSCGFDDVVNCHLWKIMDSGEIHPECPIVEVKTPHGRLIDAEKLKNEYPHDTDWDYPVNTNCYVCESIDNAPTVIEAEGEE